jgi:hypothetical protein
MFNKRLITALVAAGLLFSVLSAGPALAARHGGGGSTGTLSVTPDPAPAGISTITVTGTGFSANQALKVGVANVFGFQSVATDSTGAFSVAITNDFGSSTWYTVEAGYQNNKGVFVALATTTFTVCSTNPC